MKKEIKNKNTQMLPAKNGVVSEQNLRLAKEIFLQETIKQLLDFVKVGYEYPDDTHQELTFNIDVVVLDKLDFKFINYSNVTHNID